MKTAEQIEERFEANKRFDPEEDLAFKIRKNARDKGLEIVGSM